MILYLKSAIYYRYHFFSYIPEFWHTCSTSPHWRWHPGGRGGDLGDRFGCDSLPSLERWSVIESTDWHKEILTWYRVISDGEWGVSYLRVYHWLGHIFPLDLHGKKAASKNFTKNINITTQYSYDLLDLPFCEKERIERNINLMRDHIVHYSRLDLCCL